MTSELLAYGQGVFFVKSRDIMKKFLKEEQ